MACEMQTFQGITQARFNCLSQKASALGVTLNGNQGQASNNGFTIEWTFDPVAQTLQIQCLNAPFLVPCSVITSRIQQAVDGCP